MGKIKKLLESELIGGSNSEEVYPVTSTKAVYDANNKSVDTILTENSENIHELGYNVSKSVGISMGEMKSGLLTESGVNANGNWRYIDYVPISIGDLFYITIKQPPGSPYIPMQLYNSDKGIVENIMKNFNGFYTPKIDGYIRICGQAGKELSIAKLGEVNVLYSTIDNLTAKSENLSSMVEGNYNTGIDFSFQGYINPGGKFIPNVNQRTTDFLEYDIVRYSIRFQIETLGSYISFYDKDKTYLPELSNQYKTNGIYKDNVIIKPKGAKYYRITSSANYSYSANYADDGLISSVNQLKGQQDINTDNITKNSESIKKLESGLTEVDIPFDFQGYIGASGQFVSHPNGKTTDFLPYDKVVYSLTYGLSVLNCSYINFYDKNHQWLQELSAEYKKDETVTNKELVKPEGAAYYRITASTSKPHSAHYLSKDYNRKKIISRNVNWVGHSIWWYDGNKLGGNGEVARGYQTLLKEQFGITQTGNYCHSGHSLGGLTTEDKNSLLESTAISTWQPSENAIWTLDTITNDFKRNIPIGTIDDYNNNTGITTYYGALRVFKDKVTELSGEDAIIICSNALRRNNSGYTSTSENTQGHTLEDYELALMTIASKNKWIFVDQFRMCGVTDNSIMTTTIDGLHLNNFGYTLAVIPWIWAFDYIYNSVPY